MKIVKVMRPVLHPPSPCHGYVVDSPKSVESNTWVPSPPPPQGFLRDFGRVVPETMSTRCDNLEDWLLVRRHTVVTSECNESS